MINLLNVFQTSMHHATENSKLLTEENSKTVFTEGLFLLPVLLDVFKHSKIKMIPEIGALAKNISSYLHLPQVLGDEMFVGVGWAQPSPRLGCLY